MGSRKKIVKLPHYKIGKFVEGEQFLVTCIRQSDTGGLTSEIWSWST